MRGRAVLIAALVTTLITTLAQPAAAQRTVYQLKDDDALFSPLPGNDENPYAPEALRFTPLQQGKHKFLLVWGGINQGDSERFRAALEGARPVEEIWLMSPGGGLSEGLQIGRIIRHERLTTRIRNGMKCVSACNFAFLGGVVRQIEPGGMFGVHMFAIPDLGKNLAKEFAALDKKVAEHNAAHPDQQLDLTELRAKQIETMVRELQEDSAQTAAEIGRFLLEMQLSLRFLTAFANTPNAQVHYLTRDEMRDFNVVNLD